MTIASLRVTMQAYSSTLLQFIFKIQLVYFPYFYDDKVQKKCTNLVHSCNQMVHSYFARYSRNRKISAKNARYLPFSSDICLYLSKSHNWGGRGRKFKRRWRRQRKSHQTKIGGSIEPPIFFYFLAKSLEISRFRNIINGLVLPYFEGWTSPFFALDHMFDHLRKFFAKFRLQKLHYSASNTYSMQVIIPRTWQRERYFMRF